MTVKQREDSYDVGLDFVLPDLAGLVPAGGRVEPHTFRLESTYFDTGDRDLLARGVTLRHRTGSSDDDWQLAVPAGNARTEVHLAPATSSIVVPRELADLTTGARRGRPLRRAVTISTERTAHRLLTGDGRLLLQIADDQVHAVAPGRQSVVLTSWREIEAELGPEGDAALLAAASALLADAGASPSASPDKVAKALDAAAAASGEAAAPAPTRNAGAAIRRYLAEQDEALVEGDLSLRRGVDAIHTTRVATRRFRSSLRVFGAFVDPDRAKRLDAELSWYAGVLGQVRDSDVQRARLMKAVAELPDGVILGPVTTRIQEHLRAEKHLRQAALDRAMRSHRYARLLQETARWAAEPPFTDLADMRPGSLRKAVDSAARKVRKHLRAGLRSGDEEELHKARKAGKRARYAAELAHSVLGKKVEKDIARYQRLQDILGEHQDSMVAAALVRRIAETTAEFPGENGFTFGVLHAAERERAERSRAKALAWAAKH